MVIARGVLRVVADAAVGCQKADIGRPFEEVADQDVDRHPGIRVQAEDRLLSEFLGELAEQHIGQFLEVGAHRRDVGAGAKQLSEQREVVVYGLDFAQPGFVFAQAVHET